MSDLGEFLRARLDEDERAAQACPPWPWRFDPDEDAVLAADDVQVADVFALSGRQLRATGDYIVRHDPERALREVEAKRKIVKLHGRATLRAISGAQYYATATVCRSCEPNLHLPELSWPCPTLRLLALPYADRPGYREEWKP